MSETEQPARQDAAPELRGIITGQVLYMEHLPPEVLQRFDEAIPGSARELLDNTLAESAQRREREMRALEANIAARERLLAGREDESRRAFKNDVLGQVLGFALNLCCIGAACALAWLKPELWKVAVAIVAMPPFTVGVKVVIDSRHLRKDKSGDSAN